MQFTKAPENFSTIRIFAKGLENYTAIPTDGKGESAFLILKFADVKKKYEIEVDFDGEDKEVCFNNYFSTDRLTLGFSNEGTLFCVYADGEKIGDYDFLRSFITYDGKDYDFTNKKVTSLPLPGRSEGVRIEGEINLPGQIKEGNFVFDFVKMQGFDEIFVRTTVNYPYTPETSSISTENSSLGRYSDMKWTQAVPFQITAKLRGDLKVIKRNFIGDVSSFRTQSFPECDSKNKYIASFNHQLTGGFVGLEGENKGLLIANARQVSNSMAHCPMRLEEDKTVRMNPFGTYFGKQRHHHGRAKDQILDVYTLVAAQGKSIAPAYNGNSETAVMALSVCDDAENDPKQTDFLKAFADGAVITCPADSTVQPFDGDNTVIKEAQKDSISENDLRNPVMTGIAGNLGRYIVKGSKAIMHIIFTQLKNG